MNSATNVQPSAGHGNGAVATQNQPVWSASSPSRQSSSSSTSSIFLEHQVAELEVRLDTRQASRQ